MNVKRLCSIGILDINLNFVLHNNLADFLNFNIDSFNTIEDLAKLLDLGKDKNELNNEEEKDSYNNFLNINYLDFITLTSDNYLINTLLYINRASKIKTFIEFIMPNQLDYNDNTKFVKKIIEDVLAKNYFFIVENPITDIPSRIKFIIKIINDNNEVISSKNFELFESNEIDIEEIENENNDKNKKKYQDLFINKINYNFSNSNYFIIDLKEIRNLLIEYQSIYSFLYKIVNNYPNIKIILIIDDNINAQSKEEVLTIKKFLDLNDIIFSFKNNMNNFLKSFYSIQKRNIYDVSPSKLFFLPKNNTTFNSLDLITKDFYKYRQNIPRISVIFEEFNLIHVYKQEFLNKSLSYESIFPLLLIKKEDISDNKKEFIYSNSNKLYHIYIGGFLSKFIYNNSFDLCLKVGKLLMLKAIDIFLSKKECYTNQENYNIEIKLKSAVQNKKIKKLLSKEKHFILDCTNIEKSKKKEYNILSDNNCLGFITKNYNSKNKKKISLMDRVEIFLKRKKKKTQINTNKILSIIKNKNNNYSQKKIKGLLPFISINDIDKYSNNKEKYPLNNYKKSKTISYCLTKKDEPKKKRKNFCSLTNSIDKKNKEKKRIINNILDNIEKIENYNKYLFKIYQPNKKFEDFLNEYNNNLQNIKIYK